ncbi:substrate-binding domain-containing protein [Haloplanus litoreus]|uniref:substrate-binding domain-containing protein n=1 Tax=Haloplanus litoreus TaxID=767515 RepID=UPI0036159312
MRTTPPSRGCSTDWSAPATSTWEPTGAPPPARRRPRRGGGLRAVRPRRRRGGSGGWTREWGLVVPAGNPDGVDGLADLVDRDLRFVDRAADSGLRASLDTELDRLADARGVDRRDLIDAIDGYDLTVKGFESPARKVIGGAADVGLGLRATADTLDCGFVPLGTESVRVLANPDRTNKPGVEALRSALDTHLDDALVGLSGFDS